jgi:hypothetical protein
MSTFYTDELESVIVYFEECMVSLSKFQEVFYFCEIYFFTGIHVHAYCQEEMCRNPLQRHFSLIKSSVV